MKDFDKCIESCDIAIDGSQGKAYDYVKLAKVMARKANALLQQEKFDESIALYQKAMLEDNQHIIKMALNKAKDTKKKKEAAAYVNPELAE